MLQYNKNFATVSIWIKQIKPAAFLPGPVFVTVNLFCLAALDLGPPALYVCEHVRKRKPIRRGRACTTVQLAIMGNKLRKLIIVVCHLLFMHYIAHTIRGRARARSFTPISKGIWFHSRLLLLPPDSPAALDRDPILTVSAGGQERTEGRREGTAEGRTAS